MTTTHFNGLSEAEAERLTLLAEECSEVIQAVCKIQRHGFESTNPDLERPDARGRTNREELEREMGHVLHACQRLAAAGDLNQELILDHQAEKAAWIEKYLHHDLPCTAQAHP